MSSGNTSAGNLLWLEESVQSLVETGVLTGLRGAYRLAQPLPTVHIPPSLLALLTAWIDGLPPRDKQLVQSAAVIGKGVAAALLEGLWRSANREAVAYFDQALEAARTIPTTAAPPRPASRSTSICAAP